MKIFLTNDDGIHSKGIEALAQVLSQEAEVFVLAPDRERSTVSHSLTLHKPLRVKEKKGMFGNKVPAFEMNGMPADCVKVGIRALMQERPDLVIAGINEGPNLGTDVVYSGTVSAAREAVIEGVPGIAVSVHPKDKNADFIPAAKFVKDFVLYLKERYWRPQMLFNINIPLGAPHLGLNDFRITRLGERKYDKLLEKRRDPAGQEYYWMMGELIDEDKNAPDSDVRCVLNGKVSVTPLHYDLTDQKEMNELKKTIINRGDRRGHRDE